MSDYNDGILPTPCLRMDTHFGDEYESIEFGDGTGYIKAAPILAKVGALHEEIDRLRDESGFLHECIASNARDANAENEQLRRERDFFFQQVTENGERAHGAIDALNAENAKLRELVQDVMPIVCDGCRERLCKMPEEEHPFTTCWFADRMFELGIEVD